MMTAISTVLVTGAGAIGQIFGTLTDLAAPIVAAEPVSPTGQVSAAGSGLLDFLEDKSDEAMTTARAVALLLALVFFIWQVVASRAALARMIVAGLAAGLFVWLVFNITDVKDRVDEEINSAGLPVMNVSSSGGLGHVD